MSANNLVGTKKKRMFNQFPKKSIFTRHYLEEKNTQGINIHEQIQRRIKGIIKKLPGNDDTTLNTFSQNN